MDMSKKGTTHETKSQTEGQTLASPKWMRTGLAAKLTKSAKAVEQKEQKEQKEVKYIVPFAFAIAIVYTFCQ